jgi:hypothetical protein
LRKIKINLSFYSIIDLSTSSQENAVNVITKVNYAIASSHRFTLKKESRFSLKALALHSSAMLKAQTR